MLLRRTPAVLAFVAACGDETAPPPSFPYCGDGEVCLEVERKTTTIAGGVFLPGDFDGDDESDDLGPFIDRDRVDP